ncbi:VWA domain-containing protein [Aestuariirhabdus sp. Z084]|uniref:vWA domain-containing protein n=1 Tax=Aestuariirhabdus haliotis TaxID=2918751 RepID=UPI00201B3D21|nr:VWA domain-containing protein [Aestuariirhabdus haliotis]MCL6416891.1 VWA domain-containing protein [Aestuariirhabdus haliotis]MCL6420890.1 VWA domain-containing protein [Aestuariirhabdus haliotis]
MLLDFFSEIRAAKVPATLKELLDLMEALKQGVVFADLDQFYFLARTCLVKDEKHFDKFDRAFSAYFEGLANIDDLLEAMIPEEWLRKEFEKSLTEEEKAKIESLGGLDKLLEEFKKRLEEQKKRHQGGNRWIGTGGTSPYGAYGYNPEGIRIGQEGGRNNSAVKVWDKREFRNLDEDIELGTRNIKMALRRLRKFARQGAADQLDINDTISSTAKNGGWLDLKLVPERHNAVKVLLFIDIGGTMDAHVRLCEELFSACKTEFKHLEFFYFHNCIYESVWKDNLRRANERTSTWDLLHTFGSDYKVIFIGDASMAPYEVSHVGGSVEHWNEEAGSVWLERVREKFSKVIWLNPHTPDSWGYTQSTQMIKQLVEDKMYPLTVKGLEEGMRYLSK